MRINKFRVWNKETLCFYRPTGVACKNLGRDFIGIELEDTYYQAAKEKLEGGLF